MIGFRMGEGKRDALTRPKTLGGVGGLLLEGSFQQIHEILGFSGVREVFLDLRAREGSGMVRTCPGNVVEPRGAI